MTVEQRLHDLEEQITSQKLVMDTLLQNLLNPALMVPGTLRFGGNVMELGLPGIQIKSTSSLPAFYFVSEFSRAPDTEADQAYLSGFTQTNSSEIGLRTNHGTNPLSEIVSSSNTGTGGSAYFSHTRNGGSVVTSAGLALTMSNTFGQFTLTNAVLRLGSFTSDPGSLSDGDIWYRSDLDKVYLRANGATVELSGGGSSVMPVLFGTESVISLGSEIAASAATRDASFTWPAANRRIYVPITITEDCTVVKVWWVNGAAVSGNVDFTLYTEAGVRTAITSGSTAQSGTTVIQEVNTADTALTAGRYYMSIALDNATGRISGYTPAIETVKSWGVAQEASAFTAPATATLAAAATAYVPTIGMSLRTLVA